MREAESRVREFESHSPRGRRYEQDKANSATGHQAISNKKEKNVWYGPPLPCEAGREVGYAVAEGWFDQVKDPVIREQILVYCYRKWPVINRPERERYIDKISLGDWSTGRFIGCHGSGEYSLGVMDKASGKSLFRVSWRIDNPCNPPVIDSAELEWEHPSNQRYIECLKAKEKVSAQEDNRTAAGIDIVSLAKVAKDMMEFALALRKR